MKLSKYMNERGLIASHVARKMGVTRQAFDNYDKGIHSPTLKTLMKIAEAMTELGAPTTVADISAAVLRDEDA